MTDKRRGPTVSWHDSDELRFTYSSMGDHSDIYDTRKTPNSIARDTVELQYLPGHDIFFEINIFSTSRLLALSIGSPRI